MNDINCEIIEEPVSYLAEYGLLPISFQVNRILDVALLGGGLGGLTLTERIVDCPYIKDYDLIKENHPWCWATRWDTSEWGVISGVMQGFRAAGAVIAFNTEGVGLLEGRKDIAILWDIRVHPDHRNHGVGRLLFEAAAAWARVRGCQRIKAETQNINVAACRFYAKQGCTLGVIDRYAYPDFPEETRLIWYKDLV